MQIPSVDWIKRYFSVAFLVIVTSKWGIWTKIAKLRELNSWSAERG